jgi:hypothetical protein
MMYFGFQLLVIGKIRDLGRLFPDFCKLFLIIPTGMFYPVGSL